MTRLPADELWDWKEVTGWAQDTRGCTLYEDTPEEIFSPPTFAWYAMIQGRRRKDGTLFYLRASVAGEEDQPLNMTIAKLSERDLVAQFDSFALCDCLVGSTCSRHQQR